jgi:transcriptional regulator with XRE-family HTH domain
MSTVLLHNKEEELTRTKISLSVAGMSNEAAGIVEPSQVSLWVRLKIQMSGDTPKSFAERLGVPHQTIYSILNGKQQPSKTLLAKLGLEIVYRIKQTAPEKGRRKES